MPKFFRYYHKKHISHQMTDEYSLWVIMAEINSFSQLSRNCQIPHTQYYLDNDDIKRIIAEYGPCTFSQSQIVPHSHNVFYMYQIQKADTDHPFSVPNHKRIKKTDYLQEQKNVSYFYSLMGPAATGFTNATSTSWIH